MLHLITYDLNKPGQNYPKLYDTIKSLSTEWWHYLDSTWLVRTHFAAEQIRDAIRGAIDLTDRVLVVQVTGDWASYLPADANDWIHSHSAIAA